jgi:hypothetical protein
MIWSTKEFVRFAHQGNLFTRLQITSIGEFQMKNTRIGKLVVAALFVPLIAGAFVSFTPQSNRISTPQQMADTPTPWPGMNS